MLYLNGKFVNTKNESDAYEHKSEVAEYHKTIKKAKEYYGDFLVVRTRKQPASDPLTGFPVYPSTRGLLLRTTIVEEDNVQEWLYSPMRLKSRDDGDLELKDWVPNLLVQKGAYPIDIRRNPDLAFYVMKTHYVGATSEEGKKFHLEDVKAHSKREVEKRRVETKVSYLIYNGIDEKNLRTIAKAWGIGSVDVKTTEEVMTELHKKVEAGEKAKAANPDGAHRGYDEFIDSSQIKFYDKVAALCKDAEEKGRLVFDAEERKWVIDYEDGGIPYAIKELSGDEFGDPMGTLVTFLVQEKEYLQKVQNAMNRTLERPDGYEAPKPPPITDLTMEMVQQENNVPKLKKWIKELCPDVEMSKTMKADEAKQILMARIVVSQE